MVGNQIVNFIFRLNLKRLISQLNREKDTIKKNGVKIDGQLLNVSFKGISYEQKYLNALTNPK